MTCLHPFIRNTVGCMEFGGCFLNKRLNKGNDGGTDTPHYGYIPAGHLRVIPESDSELWLGSQQPDGCFSSLSVLYEEVPYHLDETRFIDGYPGNIHCPWHVVTVTLGIWLLSMQGKNR